jgi:protein-tyrosine phosphatase
VIDLHTHILPGLDDGAPDLEAALDLARESFEQGVSVIAATPHVRPDFPAVEPSTIATETESLQRHLEAAAIPLRLVPAGEVDLTWAVEAPQDALRLVSYAGCGAWVLVETPYGPLPSLFEALLEELRFQDLEILLAHPERNPSFQDEPKRLRALVDRGIYIQVTAASLASRRRCKSRQLALALVKEGLAHVIASDAHSAGVRSSLRAGLLAAAREDPVRAHWMVTDAPAAILEAERPHGPPSSRGRSLLPRRTLRGLR